MQDPFAVWSVRSVGSGNKYLYDHPTGDKEVGGVSETGFAGLATSTGMMHKNGNLTYKTTLTGDKEVGGGGEQSSCVIHP